MHAAITNPAYDHAVTAHDSAAPVVAASSTYAEVTAEYNYHDVLERSADPSSGAEPSPTYDTASAAIYDMAIADGAAEPGTVSEDDIDL